MLGTHAQKGFFQTDGLHLDYVGRDTFYGRLAGMRGELFKDEDFADLYCADNGRPSVAPSLLATVLLLQAHDKVSDNEAKQRADYDLRWKVALGTELEERAFAKSTLQLFRSQLIVHGRARGIFRRSLQHARKKGFFKGQSMKLVIDTTAILGRGAVRDAYNLIGDGCRLLIGALAEQDGQDPKEWARQHGYNLHAGKSLKGAVAIDWSDRKQRRRFLGRIVRDADSLLARARSALESPAPDNKRADKILACSQLLSQILLQDVKRVPAEPAKPVPDDRDRLLLPAGTDAGEVDPAPVAVRDRGVAARDSAGGADGEEVEIVRGGRDRIISAHDPQMRHGRKSSTNRFAGHKAAIAVDLSTGLVTAVDVIPGNAPDNCGALALVREAEENAAAKVEIVIGDCAYGAGDTRKDFADAGYDLFARAPGKPASRYFVKQDFAIDLEKGTCTCPAGQITSDYRRSRSRRSAKTRAGLFHFAKEQCSACPLKRSCIRSATKPNRRISVHPQERLLQQARIRQRSKEGLEIARLRTRVEHRLARLCQLGVRQSRFFGRQLAGFQLLMAATVANLTLAEGESWKRKPSGTDPGREAGLTAAAANGREAAQMAMEGNRNGVAEGREVASAPVMEGPANRDLARGLKNAVAAGAIVAWAQNSHEISIQSVLNRFGGLREVFEVIANLFEPRRAFRAFRPGF